MQQIKYTAYWLAFTVFLAPGMAHSHHEAIVGPHAPAFFGNKGFVGLQAFNIAAGSSDHTSHEQVMLVSAGLTLGPDSPFSLALLQPVSQSSGVRAEDTILALRYHHNLTELQTSWQADGNFITFVAGAEFPTGNADGQEPFDGPLDTLVAALASLEHGNWSGVTYVYRRFNGYTRAGSKSGDLLYAGAGFGYALWDDEPSHQSLNLQVGLSFEHQGRTTLNGMDLPLSDGWALVTHPTIAYSLSNNWDMFLTVGIPLVQNFQDEAEGQLWRLGLGVIYTFSDSDHPHHVTHELVPAHSHGHNQGSHPHH